MECVVLQTVVSTAVVQSHTGRTIQRLSELPPSVTSHHVKFQLNHRDLLVN